MSLRFRRSLRIAPGVRHAFCAEDVDYLRTMNRPKGQPIVIAIMGGVAGYVLCGEALRMVDPSMDSSVIRFFSALAGIVLA